MESIQDATCRITDNQAGSSHDPHPVDEHDIPARVSQLVGWGASCYCLFSLECRGELAKTGFPLDHIHPDLSHINSVRVLRQWTRSLTSEVGTSGWHSAVVPRSRRHVDLLRHHADTG